MRVATGSIIDRKYCIEGPLSSGGMGSVWIARHVNLGSRVAVKLMDPTLADSPAYLARFQREARIAAHLQSPHVVHVSDYGVDEGVPYIVMELLEGEDLGQHLRRVRRIALPDAVRIFAQVGRAMRRAHEAGLVHRDLKPSNLFLAQVDGEEVVKVLDFGIVKEIGTPLTDEATRTGEVLGSPQYMSPEQVRGEKDIDARSDLWSLGVILFRALTGELPFQGDQLGVVLARILVDPLPCATELAPDLPPDIEPFFARALARDRAQRFSSIGEMIDELHWVAGIAPRAISVPRPQELPLPPSSRRASLDRAASPATLTGPGVTTQDSGARSGTKAGKPWRSRPAVAFAVGVVTALIGSAVAVTALQGGPREAAPAGAPAAGQPAAAPPESPPEPSLIAPTHSTAVPAVVPAASASSAAPWPPTSAAAPARTPRPRATGIGAEVPVSPPPSATNPRPPITRFGI